MKSIFDQKFEKGAAEWRMFDLINFDHTSMFGMLHRPELYSRDLVQFPDTLEFQHQF